MNFKKHFKAQSLIEILIGIGVVAIVFSAITGLMYVSLQNSKNSRERSLAQTLIDDSSSAISGIINYDWHSLYSSEGGVGYWPLDEGVDIAADNKIVLDEISGNNGLINLGSAGNTSLANAWQSDSSCISGKCLSFDGSDDQIVIDISTTSSLDLTNNFTISLWIYPTDNNTSRPIISKTDAGLNLGYKIENNSGILKSSIFSLGTSCVLSTGNLDLNQWQLITVVYNGSNISHYKNGELQGAPFSCSISVSKNTEDFLIGAQLSDSSKFAGKMDEIRIYQRVLTQDEISNLFNYPANLYSSNVGGIWRIREGIEKLNYAGIEFSRSFKVLAAFRDTNGNLVNDNGNFDPLTKKIVYTVLWGNKKLEETQYVSRVNNNLVFAQTDWSNGPNPDQIVITAPNFFDEASSSIIYTTPDLLTIELASETSSRIDDTYYWAWNDLISWIDFHGIYYVDNELRGVASSSIGEISTNCLDLSVCATSNYQMKISSTTTIDYNEGDLYGYAWSPAIGWISFNCNQTGVGGTNDCATSNYKVSMATSTGYFSGFAWNDVIGWISFNCSDLNVCEISDYKVKMNYGSRYNEGYLISSIFDSGVENGVVPISIIWQGTFEIGTRFESSFVDDTYYWAWNDLISWIDFHGIYYDAATNELQNTASSSIGEISTNCLDLSVCETSDYQVNISITNDADYNEGDLYGYAWSPAIGWISFNCNQTGVGGTNDCATSNYKVSMATSTGYFSGFAWNDVIGWISFNCSDLNVCEISDYKVKMNLVTSGGEINDSEIKFQIASSNSSNGPWNFIGEDGTTSSYYPSSGSLIPNVSIPLNSKYHYNHRYFRYKIFLSSINEVPVITDLAILFNK